MHSWRFSRTKGRKSDKLSDWSHLCIKKYDFFVTLKGNGWRHHSSDNQGCNCGNWLDKLTIVLNLNGSFWVTLFNCDSHYAGKSKEQSICSFDYVPSIKSDVTFEMLHFDNPNVLKLNTYIDWSSNKWNELVRFIVVWFWWDLI